MFLKPLSQERFEAFVGYTRHSITVVFIQELEYWADFSEKVIGLLALDLTDNDYSIAILGRDERERFRAIDVKTSIRDEQTARSMLFQLMNDWFNRPREDFYQDDLKNKGLDLFTTPPTLNEDTLNSSFKVLRDSEGFSSAKEIIAEVMPHYEDIDNGQFITRLDNLLPIDDLDDNELKELNIPEWFVR